MNHSHWEIRKRCAVTIGGHGWHTVSRLYWLVTLTFRIVASAWGLAVALGVGIVRFAVNLCAAVLGLALLLFVGHGLARVLLYPLFHAN